jgi:hypothetical protein
VRVLLAGCGDIRNLLSTIHAALASDTDCDDAASGFDISASCLPPMEFVLNDGSVSMLARNAVMLHMIAALGTEGADAVLNVWASHTLPEAHADLLKTSLHALAHDPWPSWLSASTSLDNHQSGSDHGSSAAEGFITQPNGKVVTGAHQATAEQAIRAAIAAWAGCSLTVKDLERERSSVMRSLEVRAHRRVVCGMPYWCFNGNTYSSNYGAFAMPQTFLGSLLARCNALCGALQVQAAAQKLSLAAVHGQAKHEAQSLPKRVTDDVESYIKTGSLEAGTAPNPTFFTAPDLQCR